MSKEHIVFLFPGAWSVPIGGYKVIYEYANRFVQDGYNVTIVYPAQVLFKKHAFFNKLCILAFYIKNIIFKKYEPYSWFPLDKRVQLKYVWSLKEKNVPYADVYVATAVETAIYLNEYTNDRAQKYYFIQGYETWAVCEDRLWESYKYKMNKIVIAPWLLDKVRAVGQEAIMIYNGFDFKCFCLIKDIEFKDKYCVSMLYHTSKLKGCDVAFAALNRVKDRIPQLHVNLFGFPDKPKNLPDWFTYYKKPNRELLNKIYNNSAIFIGASYSEGFCLTPPEAMMCGCAIACTDIGGYTVICKHEENSLLSPVGDNEALAMNIIRLIEDDDLRIHLAGNGYAMIQEFTWDRAYDQLKRAFQL